MARVGQSLGRPGTGLLFILLLSSLEGQSLAARIQKVAVDRAVVVAPDLSRPAAPPVVDAGPLEQDLQCVAVLCWLESFQSGPGHLVKALSEPNHAFGMANNVAVELGKRSVAAVAHAGLVGSLVGGVISAVKVKAEGCKGTMFSCVGKQSLAAVVLSVTGILLFIAFHLVAVPVALGAGVKVSLGSLGFFFGDIFAYLCRDELDEASAGELVRGLNGSLARENPEVPGVHLPDEVQSRVAGMLAQVQAARRRMSGNSSLSATAAHEGSVGRVLLAMLGLHTLEDVQCFCDSAQAALTPEDDLAALGQERDGEEWVEALRQRHSGSIMQGWVWKRHRFTRQWHRRWLVLTPGQLAAFRSECSDTPTDTVPVGTVQRVYAADDECLQPWSFAVESAGRKILMLSDEEDQREAWVREIGKAFLEGKP